MPPSNFAPIPKGIAGGAVQGLFGDLQMQQDLSAVVAFVGERVTEKSHRPQFGALDFAGAFSFGKKLLHGLAGIDKCLPQGAREAVPPGIFFTPLAKARERRWSQ